MTYRTIFETALTILAWSFLATDSTFADEETRVFIFAGQSNMLGADALTEHIDEMVRNDRQVTIIKTSHLPHERHHFGTKGTLLLGEEMANAYLKKP